MTIQDDNPKSFSVKQKLCLHFVPRDDQGELGTNSIASTEAASLWNTHISKVLWHVRWTQKGLMPIKPAVHLIENVTLAAGRALHLTN